MKVEEFIELIRFWGACEEGYNWAYRGFGPDGDARRIYEQCEHPDWIEWLLDHCAGLDRYDDTWTNLINDCLDVILTNSRNTAVPASPAFLAELARFERHWAEHPDFDDDDDAGSEYRRNTEVPDLETREGVIVNLLVRVTMTNVPEVRLANLLYGLPPGEPYAVTLCDILRRAFPWGNVVDKLQQRFEENCR